LPAIAGLWLAALSGPAGGAVEPGAAVEREFAAICESMANGKNPYYGRGRLRELRAQLTQLREPNSVAATRGLIGHTQMILGDPEAAIATLSEVLEQATALELDPQLHTMTLWYLALAHLQLAEDENCVLSHSADSCLFPISAAGIHRQPEHSRRAGDYLVEYLKARPDDGQAGWLLNLARQVSGDYPAGVPARVRLPADALRPTVPFARWRDRAPDLGIAVVDLAGGAVMDDFDGDGFLDLVTSTWDPCGGLKAYRNDGRGGFDDVSAAWGLKGQLGGLNLHQVDYDGDGRLDLFVLRGAWMLTDGVVRNSLLRNVQVDGATRFVDVTREPGLAEPAFPTQAAAWADFDNDGDLDLYIGNEATRRGVPDPSQLFRNNGPNDSGQVTFTDIAAEAGVRNDRYCKAVAWGDYDNDGDPDLFVSNFGKNRLFRNDSVGGQPIFTDVAPQLGLTHPERESFTSWFFDYDNDGDLDLFVSDYRQQAPAVAASYYGVTIEDGNPLLYRNDGGSFTEVSRSVGLDRPLMPMGGNYGDLDNDGWLDIYLGTGEPDLASLMPNVMYRNAGGRFEDVTFAGGFGHLQKGHGVAFGDLDHDGDQDIFHQLGGFYPADDYANALFENPGGGGNWVTLFLEGGKANHFAVGARIEARLGSGEDSRSVHLVVGSGGSFGSSSLRQEMGLGSATRIEELIVRWPGSLLEQRFVALEANRAYRLVEGKPDAVVVDLPSFRLGSDRAGHVPAP